MRISARVRRLQPSLTLALIARTNELRAAGRDIITLGAGEPDFVTPDHIRDAAKAAIDAGHTHYTEVGGIKPLRTAIAASYGKFDLEYSPNDVVVTAGAKHALFNALLALVDDGDRVIIPTPSWLSYPEMVKAAGGEPLIVPCSEEDGFRLTPDALRTACEQGAKALILNGVSNPTGAVHSPADHRALAEVAAEFGLFVISDEIYERLVYEPFETSPFAAGVPAAKDLTLHVSGVSKTFAMTGWRIGYAAGPTDIIGAMRKLQGQSTSNVCSIAQHAALEALTGDQAPIEAMRQSFAARRTLMMELLAKIPDLHVTEPGGAFYVFPRVDSYYGRREGVDGSISMAEAMLNDVGIAVVPGLPFGSDAHIRLSYACSEDDIRNACGRLAKFFAGL